jgi:hypothetical protein
MFLCDRRKGNVTTVFRPRRPRHIAIQRPTPPTRNTDRTDQTTTTTATVRRLGGHDENQTRPNNCANAAATCSCISGLLSLAFP